MPVENLEVGAVVLIEVSADDGNTLLWCCYEVIHSTIDSVACWTCPLQSGLPYQQSNSTNGTINNCAGSINTVKRLSAYLVAHSQSADTHAHECGSLSIDILLHRREKDLDSLKNMLQFK